MIPEKKSPCSFVPLNYRQPIGGAHAENHAVCALKVPAGA